MPLIPKQQAPYYTAGQNIKHYLAVISQNATDAPTANILLNTYNQTPIWSRITDGQYNITITDELTIAKTIVFLTPGEITADPYYLNWFKGGSLNNDAVAITTTVGSSPTDDVMFEASIHIITFP